MSQAPRFVSQLTRNTLALILAGGRGSRLKHLTLWRAKPAVPFGGKFRMIDFPLSNCVNSGIRRISVLTQYKAHSLINHIQRGWGSMRGEFGEFVELLPAQQRLGASWYAGTADAIYQNLDILQEHGSQYVLILAGDHIYKMDYGLMIAAHVRQGADLTVGCVEVPLARASEFGVMTTDTDGRIIRFSEKPPHPEPTVPGGSVALASMGIYVFNTQFLFEQLIKDSSIKTSHHDFGLDIIPAAIENYRVMSYPFNSGNDGLGTYWRDVGTPDAYWEANMELIAVTPELNLYDTGWPIWTFQEQHPPAKFVFDQDDGRRGMAVDSMVSGGCVMSGANIRHSLLFSAVTVHSYTTVTDSVVMNGADIDRHCRIRRAIIEECCRIPAGTIIGEDAKEDARNYHVTPGGIVVVTPEMLGQEPRVPH